MVGSEYASDVLWLPQPAVAPFVSRAFTLVRPQPPVSSTMTRAAAVIVTPATRRDHSRGGKDRPSGLKSACTGSAVIGFRLGIVAQLQACQWSPAGAGLPGRELSSAEAAAGDRDTQAET